MEIQPVIENVFVAKMETLGIDSKLESLSDDFN